MESRLAKFKDYREFLKSVLAGETFERKISSARAFSKKIGISTSHLSEIFSKKKSLSLELAHKIASRLRLTDLETKCFFLMVQIEGEKNPESKIELQNRLLRWNSKISTTQLKAEIFTHLADWKPFALLEALQIPEMGRDVSRIANALNIKVSEVNRSIQLLLDVGAIIEKDCQFVINREFDCILSETKVPNETFSKFHLDLLEIAESKQMNLAPANRVSTSMVIAFDSTKLPVVERLADEFVNQMIRCGSELPLKDKVYGLSLHFFPLGPPEKNPKS